MVFLQIVRALSAGILNTLLITFSAMAIGMTGGLLLSLIYQLTGPFGKKIHRCCVYTLQSIPSLVLIFMTLYGLPLIGIRTPPFLTVAACLGLVASAYIGEVFRGALDSIDRLQREAGIALGMTKRRVFWSILMPQMGRLSVPGIINEFTSVLKASPFAYVAGVPEILKEAQTLTAVTSRGLPVYTAAALIFLLLYLGCHALFHLIYRRFHIPGFEES